MKRNLILAATVAAPLLSACGGGGSDNPPPLVEDRLCPAALDYGTVYTGGAGSGELVKLQLDTTRMTWQVSYIESPVPRTTGTVTPTRAGTVDSGTLTQETLLPTNKLNQCAFRLNGASLDPSRPARIFVGFGVAGGTIPGKEIQFGGVLGQAAVPDTKFPYYPFIGFSAIETNLANLAGTYSHVGFGEVPSQQFAPVSIDAKVTINADGTWIKCDSTGQFAGTCRQPGTNLAQSADGSGAFQTNSYQSQVKPTLSTLPQGKGFMIVGKLRNQLVPILVRTGVANPNVQPDSNGVPGLTADDESSISILAPQTAITVGSQNGEYIGVDSAFNYRTTALINKQATLLDPFQPSQASLATPLDLDYTQKVPGTVTTVHTGAGSTTPTGKFIFTGGVFGFLDNASSTPYFTIGAFVQ
ncbi:DUF2957 domain-containing protein [Burkholderia ubonensis]|uniref:DUF2957 domain-containing protein n=1 Tax=Burkholderia ubonensis TaxID=101571 RepID=A0AB74D3N1_9BURK|nr:DUF2957 domain-containing protein [Burkholderia ubonensis]PAJ79512.1 hypothetical protein CJO71_18440 [Burkholderia ubonensis]PAJ87706.1 hypothetical protein CJO70_11365 [Burkholderia ubonensis]PAJ90304.1 hypothetical protein CJO69_32100 [Burkholderia ubonensis]PAK00067.1 hypothetical protein CJO68_16795 [Burkholderia ubonensis]PAK08091.1 hypothetical protein CJO67_10710 [Burkholderia ubonensis]